MLGECTRIHGTVGEGSKKGKEKGKKRQVHAKESANSEECEPILQPLITVEARTGQKKPPEKKALK